VTRFGSVVFDCDSTLSAVEGIDELAGEARAQIEALTGAAMRGEVPLQDVYGRRLAIARPGRERVAALGRRYVEALVPGARETVRALCAAGVQVRVVSGGLLPAVLVLTRELGLPDGDVAAVDIRFGDDGAYAGFDASSPLARSDGKATVLRSWLPELRRPSLMVGDGITDLEARPPADSFAAFTGVVARERVIAAADFVAATMDEIRRLVLG
jgi:phosphoserine phosphatase